MSWQEYQKKVAKIFRKLGCYVKRDHPVKGVRGRHKIDVWVKFRKFGFTIQWVIECKKWNTRIPKEKVLALKSIVEDIGADRGILVTELGFQKGAIEVAKSSNITLTRLQDLTNNVINDLNDFTVNDLEKKIAKFQDRVRKLYSLPEGKIYKRFVVFPKKGLDKNRIKKLLVQITCLEHCFHEFKKKQFPLALIGGDSGKEFFLASNYNDFLKISSKVVKEIENKLADLEWFLVQDKENDRVRPRN